MATLREKAVQKIDKELFLMELAHDAAVADFERKDLEFFDFAAAHPRSVVETEKLYNRKIRAFEHLRDVRCALDILMAAQKAAHAESKIQPKEL